LSALAPDALAGLEVGYAGAQQDAPAPTSADGEGMRSLAGGLAELGARIAADDAPVDLLLVPVDGEPSTADGDSSPGRGATDSLDAAATGAMAASLTAAFSAARDGAPRIRPGGCLVFVLSLADIAAHAAITSLTRTLALEWAPDVRVNAIACTRPADAVDLAALVAWRPSRTLTGAVLDAV